MGRSPLGAANKLMAGPVAFQKSYERVKVALTGGDRVTVSDSYAYWYDWFKKNDLPLLDSEHFRFVENQAARAHWENHKWDKRGKLLLGDQASVDAVDARLAKEQEPRLWGELNRLITMSRGAKQDDPQAVEARKALIYIVSSNGGGFRSEFRKEAVSRCSKAILDVCKVGVAGRGDLEPALASLISEEANLDPAVKENLLQAYSYLIEPNGKVSRERAADVYALSLQTEFNNMPPAGAANYKAKVDLQTSIMKYVASNCNKEMLPVFQALAAHHKDEGVRARARQYFESIQRGPQVERQGDKTSVVTYVTGESRKFGHEGNVLTSVTDTAGVVWTRQKEPGGTAYSNVWKPNNDGQPWEGVQGVEADGTYWYSKNGFTHSIKPDLSYQIKRN